MGTAVLFTAIFSRLFSAMCCTRLCDEREGQRAPSPHRLRLQVHAGLAGQDVTDIAKQSLQVP